MRSRAFKQVDVFTAVPYRGNPLAVVLDGAGLSTEQMQSFEDWTNLSESTFFLPATDPRADYHVRIFCPGRELSFAGHPTIGSCHAWLEGGGRPKRGDVIVQECGVGLVELRRVGGRLAFRAPPLLRSGPLPEEEVTLIARGLGLARAEVVDHAWCDNGPSWRAVMLRSSDVVLALRPDAAILAGLDVGVVGPRCKVGVVAPRPQAGLQEHEPDFEVRAFFPRAGGMAEDPVTGSLNAALAQWMIGAGLAPERYLVSQGTALGRQGRVHVERDPQGQVWVAGDAVTCVDGRVTL